MDQYQREGAKRGLLANSSSAHPVGRVTTVARGSGAICGCTDRRDKCFWSQSKGAAHFYDDLGDPDAGPCDTRVFRSRYYAIGIDRLSPQKPTTWFS